MSGNIGMPNANKGVLQVSLSYDLNSLNTLKVGSETLDDATRVRQTHSALVELGYSITDKLSVDALIPYIRQERTTNRNTAFENFTYTQGLGDISLLLKYKVFSWINLGGGIKTPTGKDDIIASFGIPESADLQPGSGAWDYILYGNAIREIPFRKTFTVSSTLLYRFRGVNNDFGNRSYQFGDEFQVIIGLADRFLLGTQILDPSIRARFRKAGRDFSNDNESPGSGGEFLFLNPGITWAITPSFNYQFNVELPVYSNVQETQLSPTFRVNTGLAIRLFDKSGDININNG